MAEKTKEELAAEQEAKAAAEKAEAARIAALCSMCGGSGKLHGDVECPRCKGSGGKPYSFSASLRAQQGQIIEDAIVLGLRMFGTTIENETYLRAVVEALGMSTQAVEPIMLEEGKSRIRGLNK